MNSLEALDRILFLARSCDYEVREHRKMYCDMLENTIKQDLEILNILKDKVLLYIYDNEANQLYIAENKEYITDKEEQLLKEWINRG